ncbi:MAG: hypothetical protein WC836_05955 [Desulfobacula sp.]|jgi:hypothetical protein
MMIIKPNIRELLWMAAGAVMFLMVMLVVMHFQTNRSPAGQLAFKTKRVDMVDGMRSALAAASESEKSAVLAVTDHDAQTFADRARIATAEVERAREELRELLSAGGTQGEKDLLAQFSEAFADFKRIDNDLLELAGKNTNIKATHLSFGPAADALREMDMALSRLIEKSAGHPEARNVALFAFGAQSGALRIQTLFAPHIAEENDKKMDELEAQMASEDRMVHKNLNDLAMFQEFRNDPDLETAAADYARFSEIRTKILALSRENTNVRSLAISLGQKRKVVFLCQDILSSLQQAILEEPIAGVNYRPVTNPRMLQIWKSEAGK